MELEDNASSNTWLPVKHKLTSYELERDLTAGGWTFFLMAGGISTTVMGFDRAKMMRAAVERLIADVKRQKCNCLEIDSVETRSFLWVPYVNVSAHARHIQKSGVFSGQ
jgi:hypothetical protein